MFDKVLRIIQTDQHITFLCTVVVIKGAMTFGFLFAEKELVGHWLSNTA